jgi:hypothetical protein
MPMKNPGLRLIPTKSTDNVVPISAARQSRDDAVEAMWERFVAAKELSQRSMKLADGIAAGKAYAEFVQSFVRGR